MINSAQKTLPWSFHGRVCVAQCTAGELAVEADGLVLPAVATATISTTTATTIATATATAVAPTATASTTTASTTTAFTGSGFVDANHAAHPLDTLKVVNGLLFGRIVG